MNPRDLADRIETHCLGARIGGRTTIEVEIPVLLEIVAMLRRVPLRRGQSESDTRKQKRVRAALIDKALRRKGKLVDEGVDEKDAEEQAAQWLAGNRRFKNISPPTWKRRMREAERK